MDKRLLNTSHTLNERIDLIIREHINKSENLEVFIQNLTESIEELVCTERIYGR